MRAVTQPWKAGRVPNEYSRFGVVRAEHMTEDQWRCVSVEIERLGRSIDAEDAAQALTDVKCLVESIARIVLDVDGTPADPNASFDSVVNRAHNLLAGQPGYELANDSPFSGLASQASKIARNLGVIRNEYGAGHGRARTPSFADEMLTLALDGGLLWSRWALRRVGYFAKGRPSSLINDLIVEQHTFYSGSLKERLLAANLPMLEPRHQRSIGVAVGQRVMRDTFVVRWDGLDPCLESDDLVVWPRDYRLGLAFGLWFSPEDHLTLTLRSLQDALTVLDPVPDAASELTEMVDRIVAARPPGGLTGQWGADYEAAQLVRGRITVRPQDEADALRRLADVIDPGSF
jgi:hypothetical protein